MIKNEIKDIGIRIDFNIRLESLSYKEAGVIEKIILVGSGIENNQDSIFIRLNLLDSTKSEVEIFFSDLPELLGKNIIPNWRYITFSKNDIIITSTNITIPAVIDKESVMLFINNKYSNHKLEMIVDRILKGKKSFSHRKIIHIIDQIMHEQ